ncbi:MAG TPA: transglycosylase SLT domain-containing protein [Elusimicrobiota bacterium]|nr:transglycosylase SLT domain-containing protein [Elusimicrobiota bacterium]
MNPTKPALLAPFLALLSAAPVLALATGTPPAAASSAETAAFVSTAASDAMSRPAPDLDEELKMADRDYEAGLQDFESTQIAQGRAEMARAFGVIVSNLSDPGLTDSMHSEFGAMLYKIRNWNELRQAGDAAPDLDVSPEALNLSSGTDVVKMQPIPLDPTNPIVQRFIQIYTQRRPRSVEEALSRSGLYRGMILKALKKKGLPPELLYLVMTESEFKYDALSRSGAAGLWQFMPGTARKYGLKVTYWNDERYEPEKETQAAVDYLYNLYQWFGDWDLALAAYNRGEGGLGQDLQASRSLSFNALSSRDALPEQTHFYVPKFEACVLIGEHPEKYGLHPHYQTPDSYDAVKLPRALDLGIAARCAGTTLDELRRLNPELREWCTPKDAPNFELKIPRGTKDVFLAALDQVKDWNPGPTLLRYRVRPGDFLGRIARLHHTTVRSIIETNKIRRPRLIRPGMVLLIRPGREHHYFRDAVRSGRRRRARRDSRRRLHQRKRVRTQVDP